MLILFCLHPNPNFGPPLSINGPLLILANYDAASIDSALNSIFTMDPLLILAYYDAASIDSALKSILTMDPLLILA